MSHPSVLEYARYYGLSIPHTDADLSTLLQSITHALFDDNALPNLELPPRGSLLCTSKLQIGSSAVMKLAEMTKPPETERWEKILGNPFRQRDLRVEEPLLISDHEKDMRWFKKPLDLHRIVQEPRSGLDVVVSPPHNEAGFLAECKRAVEDANQALREIRLDATDSALKLLAKSTDDHASQHNIEEVYKTCLSKPKSIHSEPLSPLLTPPMPSVDFLLPSVAPDWSLKPRSDQDVPFDNAIIQLERSLKENYQICTSDISTGSPTKVRGLLPEATRMPTAVATCDIKQGSSLGCHHDPSTRIDVSKLKLEVPDIELPPLKPLECSSDDSFDSLFKEFLDSSDSPEIKDPEMGQAALRNQLEEYEDHVSKLVIKERPVVDEALLRVSVPDMAGDCSEDFDNLSAQVVLDTNGIAQCPMSPESEARLNWVPFAVKSQPNFLIGLQEHSSDGKFVAIPKKVTASKDLLWKEAGLRILDCLPEDDDELSTVESSASDKIPPAPEKEARRSEFERPEEVQVLSGIELTATDQPVQNASDRSGAYTQGLIHGTRPVGVSEKLRTFSLIDLRPPKRARLGNSSGPTNQFGTSGILKPASIPAKFSATGSLASFLDLRGKRFKKPAAPTGSTGKGLSADAGTSQDPIESSQLTVPQTYAAPTSLDTGSASGFASTCERDSQPVEAIQVPSTPEASQATTSPIPCATLKDSRVVIIDEAVVSNRSLMALLDQHTEEPIRAIYRNLHKSVDIILSASTAVIFTNLQVLKQRSLPGQAQASPDSHFSLQDRIRIATGQFETIFVLISVPSVAFNSSTELLAGFTAFCAALRASSGTTVCPIWLPTAAIPPNRKDVDPLMAWTWRLLCQYSQHVQADMSFIDDTTLWELFLCEAGINALAAQLMLGMLKRDAAPAAPSDQDRAMIESGIPDVAARTDNYWGLRRLVAMGEEERRQRFGQFVGEKCLARLNLALDTPLASRMPE